MKIQINAGHGKSVTGSYDPGAVDGVNPREGDTLHSTEHDIAMDVAERLGNLLRAAGHTTVGPFVESFADAVKRASVEKPGVLISLHCNAAVDTTAHGAEVLYYSAKSLPFAQRTLDAMVRQINGKTSKWYTGEGFRNRGVKRRTNIAVLKASCPVILWELGFITNPAEEKRLHNKYYRQAQAQAIADGLAEVAP
jgi:N-acetylmuramoyl-L-alanine amidase